MDAPELDPDPKLVKNSVIACVVDDLNDGLIVVSFSHEDEEGSKVHYQGVLLQISRKRGIPSGISFPVDHAIYGNFNNSHNDSSTLDPMALETQNEEPQNTAPLPALSQRHTYFQEKFQGPVTPENGLRSRVGLRRFIKRPARFQNSRMSLRIRNRPVLCAKCRAFCEDLKLVDKKEVDSSETATTSTSKTHGVTTRNRKNVPPIESIASLTTSSSSSSSTNTLTTNSSSNIPTTNIPIPSTTTINSSSCSKTNLDENLEDYSYVSFGTQDFIENFWKRPIWKPSLLPEPDKPKKPDKLLLPREVVLFSSSKSVPKKIISNHKMNLLSNSSSLINGHLCNNNNIESSVTKGSDCNSMYEKDTLKSNIVHEKGLKVKKSKNLKICISKLNANKSPGHEDEMKATPFTTSLLETLPTNVSSSLNETISTTTSSSSSSGSINLSSNVPVINATKNNYHTDKQQLVNLADRSSSCCSSSSSGSSSDSCSPTNMIPFISMKEDLGSSKMWENRIRKKSAVPARFRDETYVPKKIFGFKRRRADEESLLVMENAENHDEGSLELNSHVLSYDNDEMRELTTLQPHKLPPTEASSSSDTSHTSSVTTTTMPSSLLPTTTVTTMNFTNVQQQQQQQQQENNTSGEDLVVSEGMIGKVMSSKIKTPIIKISFGTEQQVTVEIPRKETELEDTREKAVRKAMKKAKKEAKRKFHDESLTNNNGTNLISSTSTPIIKPISSIGNGSSCQTPPLILNTGTILSFSNNNNTNNCDDLDQTNVDRNLEPTLMESIKTPKKKKKEKKRKRHKSVSQDEDEVNHHSNSEPLNSKQNTSTVTQLYPNDTTTTSITKTGSKKLVVTDKPCQSSASFNVTVNKTNGISNNISSDSIKNSFLHLPKTTTTKVPVQAPAAKSINDNNQRGSLIVQSKDSLLHNHHQYHQNKGNDVIETFVNNNTGPSEKLIQISSTSSSDTSSNSLNPSIEQPQRVCISLKRLCQNSYVSWDKTQMESTMNNQDEELSCSLDLQDTESEINDYPMNDSLTNDRGECNVDSFVTYTDESSNTVYKKDDIVWGKLPKSPWWPGKILGFVTDDNNVRDNVRARIMWFRASTMSCIRFSQLCPFTDHFDAKYIRRRRRGQYQLAVRDALIEAHKLNHDGAKQLYPND